MLPLSTFRDQNRDIFIRCAPCGHEVRITITEAIDRFGADCTLAQAKRRVKCTACGRLGRHGFVAVWLHSMTNDREPDLSPPYGGKMG